MALVALRPEHIRLVEPGSQLVKFLDGTIAELSYLGTTFHLLVDTAVTAAAVTGADLAARRSAGHRDARSRSAGTLTPRFRGSTG